jgi:hypothetical protein
VPVQAAVAAGQMVEAATVATTAVAGGPVAAVVVHGVVAVVEAAAEAHLTHGEIISLA